MLSNDLYGVFRRYRIDGFVHPMFYCLPFALRFEGTDILAKVFHDAFAGDFLVVTEGETDRFCSGETEREPAERYDPESGEFFSFVRQITPCGVKDVASGFFEDLRKADIPVFVVDPDSGVMLTVYGGKGFDIAAPRPEPLAPLYKKFKGSLSLIDLPEMKLKFEE